MMLGIQVPIQQCHPQDSCLQEVNFEVRPVM